MFFVWLYLKNDPSFALERMVSVMVITCPHALGLAVPLVIAVSTSLSAQKGLLIRNRVAFEKARNIDVVVFDKTGTLTKAEFGVSEIISVSQFSSDQVLFYAACLETKSEHPIATAIVKEAKKRGLKLISPEQFQAIPGKGIQGKINNKLISVVGENYLKEKGIKTKNKKIEDLNKQGKTIAYVLIEEEIIGVLALADLIKKESKQAIKKLKSMGIRPVLLTGDNKAVASWVAKELGIEQWFAEILPDKKSKIIQELQDKGFKVAMVGDGINDAPALVQADVGIAIGAGTDVAIESADIILVRSDPYDVVSVINLARITYNKIKQNLLWATGYNFFAIPLAAGALYPWQIILSPAFGALLMSLSTVIVAVNARFLRFGVGQEKEAKNKFYSY